MGIIQRRCAGGGGGSCPLTAPGDERTAEPRLTSRRAKMGVGDYMCVTLRGGAPWGFTLTEGEGETYRPLVVSQVGRIRPQRLKRVTQRRSSGD